MKFKKGDRVRVVETSGYIGEVGTITRVVEYAFYPFHVKLDCNKHLYGVLATPFQERELEKVN